MEFDLKSAQLAICATDWNIPMVQDFLRHNTLGIWKDLARHFDTELTPALKDVFKKALYAVLFGADKTWVKSEVTKETGIEKAGNLFCTHPVVAAMLEAREQRLGQIMSDGGAENCFGTWITIPKDDNGKLNPRSVLAVLAQARELQLLYPAFELAMNTDAYDITLYQHDGFCLAVKDKSRIDKAVREITEVVQRKADELGIVLLLLQTPTARTATVRPRHDANTLHDQLHCYVTRPSPRIIRIIHGRNRVHCYQGEYCGRSYTFGA